MKPTEFNESILEQFSHFVSGTMKEAEQVKFKESLANDKDLNQLFESYLISRDVIDIKIAAALKSKMNEWKEKQLPQNKKPAKTFFLPYRRIASAAALLAFISYSAIQYSTVKNYPDEMMASLMNFESENTRGADDKMESINSIMKKYTIPQETIAELAKITPDNETYLKAQKTMGQLYVKLGNCQEALTAMGNAGNEGEILMPITEVLCLLNQRGTNDELQSKLDELISKKDHLHYRTALEIKSKTNSFWWKLFHP